MAWLGPIITTLEHSIRTRKYQRILKEEKERKANPFIDDEAEDEEKLAQSTKDHRERTHKATKAKKHPKLNRIPKKHSRPMMERHSKPTEKKKHNDRAEEVEPITIEGRAETVMKEQRPYTTLV